MSRDRGRRYERLLADYLRRWWPSAECPPPSRPGSDIVGVPGTVWENKTAREFRPGEFVAQAKKHAGETGDIPVVIYWPVGSGEKSAASTLAIVPTEIMVRLLIEAGYAPGQAPAAPAGVVP